MSFCRIVLCSLIVCVTVGCQSMMPSGLARVFHPHQGGERENPQDAQSDPWIKESGEIARSEHPAETVTDPLHLRQVFMSSKARDIERNLGVGD